MSDTTQENDPSIEEILASIRQIISDDDEENTSADNEDVAEEEVVQAEHEPEPEDEEVDDEVFELTEKVEEEEVDAAPEPEPEPEPEEEPIVEEEITEEIEVDLAETPDEPEPVKPSGVASDILTESAAAAALAGFTKIARDIQVNRTFDGITLEDIVRAQLEPLLREWLDKNLPPMIEVLVEKELEKLSKKALND